MYSQFSIFFTNFCFRLNPDKMEVVVVTPVKIVGIVVRNQRMRFKEFEQVLKTRKSEHPNLTSNSFLKTLIHTYLIHDLVLMYYFLH